MSVGIPFRGRRAGRKMRVGCPPTPMVTWAASLHMSLAPGSEQRVTHCRYEHADQTSVHLRTLGQPAPTANRKKRGAAMKTLSSKPVHVDSDDDDLLARVAAIDVAKDSGMACTRVPDESRPGKRATNVWSIRARTSSINELADQLAEQRIERVVLEATSDYWRPFYYLLEARGLRVWLVKLNERGMLRPSFVPPVEIRQLRDYTRLRTDLTGERSRHIQQFFDPLD